MIKSFLICISIAASAPSFAQATLPDLPHPDIVEQTISSHPIVQAADARVAAAHAEARQRKSGPHDFILSGSYVRRDAGQQGNFNEWDSSISRAIRLPGKAKADKKIGALGIQIAENTRDDARHQVALLLKDYWFEWLSASAMVSIDKQELAIYLQELDTVRKRRRQKEAALLDEEEVQSALAAARAKLLASEAKQLEAKRALNNMFPNMPLPAFAPIVSEPKPTGRTREEWRTLIIQRSHELRMVEKEAERQGSLAKRARLDRFADPSVGVRLFSERGGEESGVGVFFSVPFGLNRRGSASDMRRAKALAAESNVLQARRLIEEVADRDVTRAESGIGIWQQAAVALKANTSVVERLRRAVELGDRDLIDLLRVLHQNHEMQRAEVTARVMAQDALVQLQIDAHEIWILAHVDIHE